MVRAFLQFLVQHCHHCLGLADSQAKDRLKYLKRLLETTKSVRVPRWSLAF
jgi:hypothetical protein